MLSVWPRIYLLYEGAISPERPTVEFIRKRNPYLVPRRKDSEYPPELRDAKYYKTEEVFAEFASYLKEYVLKRIEQQA